MGGCVSAATRHSAPGIPAGMVECDRSVSRPSLRWQKVLLFGCKLVQLLFIYCSCFCLLISPSDSLSIWYIICNSLSVNERHWVWPHALQELRKQRLLDISEVIEAASRPGNMPHKWSVATCCNMLGRRGGVSPRFMCVVGSVFVVFFFFWGGK